MALQLESFFADTFMPHGYCLQWQPEVLWLHVISDLVITASYFSIPIALILFLKKRRDIQFKGIFVLFALFILLCGLTHLMAIYNIWHGAYGLHGVLKGLTAIVSIITAFAVFKNLEKALSIPSPAELEKALKKNSAEKIKNKKLEIEKKAQEIFKFTTELVPSGLLVIDEKHKIVMANEALNTIFGYDKDELLGAPLATLIDQDKSHHSMLVANYMANPHQSHQMAAGRVVRGLRKDGTLVDIQINLSVHEYLGEKHTFASVTDFGSHLFEHEQKNELSNRLHRAIDASDDGVWEWNLQNNHVWFSPKLLSMIGQTESTQQVLENWLDHIHPEDRSKVTLAMEHHFALKEKYDVSYRGISEFGDYQWFRARGDTIFDQHDQPILMSGILSNINQTKVLEEQLAEKTRFLDEVLQRTLSGLYVFDLESQFITYINPEFTKLTGYEFEELDRLQRSSGLEALYHPNDWLIIKHYQDQLSKTIGSLGAGIEYRFKHKAGHWTWLYARESVYSLNSRGKTKQLLGALFDITELKQRETEIRRLALDYSTTFEQAGVGIAHINLDHSFIKANPKFLDIFAYPSVQEIKKNFVELCEPINRERLALLMKKLIVTRESIFHVEKRFSRSGGQTFWADLTVSLVQSAKDDVAGYFIVILEDVTERKQMETNLSESNLALERFAYAASHDLQEPLRKISAFSGALEKRLKQTTADPEILFQLDRICDASLRMGKMIDNLLKLSRASSTPLNIRSVSLSSILVQALDDLVAKLKHQKISVILRRDVDLDVDPDAISQIFTNLIKNSISYQDELRPLVIHIDYHDYSKHIAIQYEDNGQGFPEDKTELIFEPFRRLADKSVPGTGMGLTICRQIIKAHKGRIFAKHKEQGAIFMIELPKVIHL